MKPNEYKCNSCQNIYEKGWTDEEAENEAKEIWGEIQQVEMAIICDDCFNVRNPTEIKAMGDEYHSNKSVGE